LTKTIFVNGDKNLFRKAHSAQRCAEMVSVEDKGVWITAEGDSDAFWRLKGTHIHSLKAM
jgi:hypothetical protein